MLKKYLVLPHTQVPHPPPDLLERWGRQGPGQARPPQQVPLRPRPLPSRRRRLRLQRPGAAPEAAGLPGPGRTPLLPPPSALPARAQDQPAGAVAEALHGARADGGGGAGGDQGAGAGGLPQRQGLHRALPGGSREEEAEVEEGAAEAGGEEGAEEEGEEGGRGDGGRGRV